MLLHVLAKTLFLVVLVLGVFAPLMTWIERKQSAVLKDRIGANRADVGRFAFLGLLHPLADLPKLLTRADVVPAGANRVLHTLAPMIAAVPAIAAFAVIPYGGAYTFGGTSVSFVIADIDWGLLYVFALGSIATYGAVLSGWSSSNNWSVLGGVRAAAQMISYEVVLGLSVVGVFMVFGSLKLTDIAHAQDQLLWSLWGPIGIPNWGIFLQPLGFVMFLACIMAENKRSAFDLPESGSELAAGDSTEYSGMRFGLFYMTEFIGVVVIAGLMTSLFLGGWAIPLLSTDMIIAGLGSLVGEGLATIVCALLHVGTFIAKMAFMIWLQILIRWSLPRFRYDQLMNLCWKVMLPLSLLNIFMTAAGLLVFGQVA